MIPRFLDAVPLDFFLVALRYTLMEQGVLHDEFPRREKADVGVAGGLRLQFRDHRDRTITGRQI